MLHHYIDCRVPELWLGQHAVLCRLSRSHYALNLTISQEPALNSPVDQEWHHRRVVIVVQQSRLKAPTNQYIKATPAISERSLSLDSFFLVLNVVNGK